MSEPKTLPTPDPAGPAPRRKKLWVLYDGRAAGGSGTDEASVYCCASSLKEAQKDKREMFPDAEIYEYDILVESGKTNQLVNERWIP